MTTINITLATDDNHLIANAIAESGLTREEAAAWVAQVNAAAEKLIAAEIERVYPGFEVEIRRVNRWDNKIAIDYSEVGLDEAQAMTIEITRIIDTMGTTAFEMTDAQLAEALA